MNVYLGLYDEYINFLDIDDWIEYDVLEVMLLNIRKLDVSILLISTYREQKNISINNFIFTKSIFTKVYLQKMKYNWSFFIKFIYLFSLGNFI